MEPRLYTWLYSCWIPPKSIIVFCVPILSVQVSQGTFTPRASSTLRRHKSTVYGAFYAQHSAAASKTLRRCCTLMRNVAECCVSVALRTAFRVNGHLVTMLLCRNAAESLEVTPIIWQLTRPTYVVHSHTLSQGRRRVVYVAIVSGIYQTINVKKNCRFIKTCKAHNWHI